MAKSKNDYFLNLLLEDSFVVQREIDVESVLIKKSISEESGQVIEHVSFAECKEECLEEFSKINEENLRRSRSMPINELALQEEIALVVDTV